MRHPLASTVLCLGLLLPSTPSHAQDLSILQHTCDVTVPGCVGGIPGLRGAFDVAISPDGLHAYVVGALDDALLSFSIDASTGLLTPFQTIFDTSPGIDGLDSARGVAVAPDGRTVYVAALLDHSVTAFSRDASSGMLTYVATIRDNTGGVNGLGGAHDVVVSPDSQHVYVVGRADNAIAAFARNTTSGALTFLHVVLDTAAIGLDDAEALTISPDGQHVYVAAETDNAVTVFARNSQVGDPNFGRLTFVESHFDGAGGVDGLAGAGSVAIAPDGRHVYVGAERSTDGGDWMAVFARNASTGALTFVQSLREDGFTIFTGCGGVGPENAGVAVSPDGRFVYLTNPFRGTLAQFVRAPSGAVTLVNAICDRTFDTGLVGLRSVRTTPDGRFVIANSLAASSVVVLSPAAMAPSSNLVATSIAGNVVTLRWQPPAAGIPVTGFEVQGGVDPGQVLATLPTGSAAPTFTFAAPTGAFYVRVRGANGDLRSAPSNEIRIFVNTPTAPSAPAGLTGLVSGSSIALSWRNTAGGGSPTSVVLDVTGSIVTSIPLGLADAFTFAGVPAGTYTLALRATNAFGSSPPSNAITLSFPGACSGVPMPPENFLAYRMGNTIVVVWDPAASGPATTGYVLSVTGAFTGNIPTAARTLSGAVGPGTYNLSVAGTNACGQGTSTAVQSVTVP